MLDRKIAEIQRLSGCRVLPPNGQPRVLAPQFLPADLKDFYSECGGIFVFDGSDFPINIVSPNAFDYSNQIIVGTHPLGDKSDDWYVIATSGADQFVSIDLSEERNGRCYDSFWDRHGIVGSCPVIANSFLDFLTLSIKSNGRGPYWLESDFVALGDAYD